MNFFNNETDKNLYFLLGFRHFSKNGKIKIGIIFYSYFYLVEIYYLLLLLLLPYFFLMIIASSTSYHSIIFHIFFIIIIIIRVITYPPYNLLITLYSVIDPIVSNR